MPAITGVARRFFDTCEAGKGWQACRAYCTQDATFSAQCEPLAEIGTMQAYTDWIAGALHTFRSGWYEVRSVATDEAGASVSIFSVFSAAAGGKDERSATRKMLKIDYVYVLFFEGQEIRHMTKVWNAGWTMREMGWT